MNLDIFELVEIFLFGTIAGYGIACALFLTWTLQGKIKWIKKKVKKKCI